MIDQDEALELEARMHGWFCRLCLAGLEPCPPGQGVPDVGRVRFWRQHGFDGLYDEVADPFA